MKRIAIINGPNLNLLGTREPGVYGEVTFDSFFEKLKTRYSQVQLSYFQSNEEGDLVNQIHSCEKECDAVILNPGAFTHTSLAIADAVAAISKPVVEVHISNVYAREPFRQTSFIAAKCKGRISGFGLDSYRLAVESLLQ